ncbi:MAG: hypothetical protein N2515_00400 [Deltaproteobacteria bacterium]|nr:hypothetical protein [Deltaproteobacteria bacterium]
MLNPFEVFGITPRFEIDIGELEKRYRSLHRAALKNQRQSSDHAIILNRAFQILRDEIERGNFLLRLMGASDSTESHTMNLEEGDLSDFLSLRESFEQAQNQGDLNSINALLQIVNEECKKLRQEFDRALITSDQEGAKRSFTRFRFYKRLMDELIKAKEEISSQHHHLTNGSP